MQVRKWVAPRGLTFARPLVLLQSDDWGRVGIRDTAGFEELRNAGLALGEHPYDFYSLETAEDVIALHEMLRRHHDSIGRTPSMVMNFVMANLDFPNMRAEGFRSLHLQPLAEGLPGTWNRPGLFDCYRTGIAAGTFYPALHGTTHFCRSAVQAVLQANDHRTALLRRFWQSETPYIYPRMPWIGYEYWNPGLKQFLERSQQEALIRESIEFFTKMFGTSPLSACAPGYRANEDTYQSWRRCGIRVLQNGSGTAIPIHLDKQDLLSTHRNVDFEPATLGTAFSLRQCLRDAKQNLDKGTPAVVSVHSINFHSSLRNFRTPTLILLNHFLTTLEREYPELLYVNDADLYQLATSGTYDHLPRAIGVVVKQHAVAFGSAAGGES